MIKYSLLVLIGMTLLANAHEHNSKNGHATVMMQGMYGPYPMMRENSGTSWQPETKTVPGLHWMHEQSMTMVHGFANALYDHQAGPRGDDKCISENMLMAIHSHQLESGILGLRAMVSLEPATIGACGYPLLLQTGETCNGRCPLIDRQHPHDLFMELATAYSYTINEKSSWFVYFGLPGEPALGPPVYMHRLSGWYNPQTPITHHWVDSTHITFGVATVGAICDCFKIDASIFTGREPDQHRWNFDRPRFDSYSIRLSYNPSPALAAQISYGFLRSPEQLEPDINVRRLTCSIMYTYAKPHWWWATTAAIGINHACSLALPGALLESTFSWNQRVVLFERIEWVRKNELTCDKRIYTVGSVTCGGFIMLGSISKTQWQVGGCLNYPILGHKLNKVYGSKRISGMVLLRMELMQ